MTEIAIEIAQAVPLVDMLDIELVAAGTWRASTGETTFTREDLEGAVAALDCPGVRNPVLKLGHMEEDSTGGIRWDGEPAVGYIANMRLSDGGAKIIGDYKGVPAWLADVMATAYPSRSVEIYRPWRCQIGHIHPSVITALALLGVQAPGVGVLKSLQDVKAIFTQGGGHDFPATLASDGARETIAVTLGPSRPGRRVELKFNPNQKRDPDGKWGDGLANSFGAAAELLDGREATVSPDEVDTLMASLADAPPVNLARLEIKGENGLFRKHAREITRADMPQLPTDPARLAEFTDALGARGITGELEEVDPRTLSATQNELDSAKVAQMYARAKAGTLNREAVAFVAQDGKVLDGHHRWAAFAAANTTGTNVKMKVIRLDADIDTLLEVANGVSGPRKTVGAPA